MSDAADLGIATGGHVTVDIRRYQPGVVTEDRDEVSGEVPVALVYNGISHAVMLASPLDLQDFALGFSFSEGIVADRSEIYDIEQVDHDGLGIEMHLTIATQRFAALKDRRRSLAGRTGCGLCGLESLQAFEATLPGATTSRPFAMSRSALLHAFRQLQTAQPINAVTGAMHAAALVDGAGQIVMVREDLGRHNALDKLIGAVLDQKLDAAGYCVIMTSRASYELAQKAARTGFALLATISAPTSLAVRLARQSGLTLIGFARNDRCVAYSHPERLQID